jgi:hypothetical protein
MTQLRSALLLFIMLVGVGCMPMTTPTSDGGAREDMEQVGAPGNADALPASGRTFSEQCDNNAQCASMLCTKDSYDRLTYSICTYKCDPAAPSSPQCPSGCNMKGYCRLPNK